MNVLWKCCKRTLKENRNRTIVTIFGVALATGLITAAACLGFSLIASYTDYVKLTDGDAHAIFSGVAGKDLKRFFNNQSIDQTWIAKREGYVAVEESKYKNVKNFIEVSAVDEEWFSHHNNGILLADGRLPKTENEIVLDRRIHNEWGMDVKIGDKITLAVGDRFLGGQKVRLGAAFHMEEEIRPRYERTFVIVGLTEEKNVYALEMAYRNELDCFTHVYRAFTYFDEKEFRKSLEEGREEEQKEELYDVSIRYNRNGLKHYEEVNAAILGISPETYRHVFRWDFNGRRSEEEILSATEVAKNVGTANKVLGLIMLESKDYLNKNTYLLFFSAVIVFLVLVYAGVFCINNSFDLSFTERVRFYGLLSSIGTTKGQRRKMVWMEGVIIGFFGIPAGLFLGTLLAFAMVQFVNVVLRSIEPNSIFHMAFRINNGAMLIAAALSFVMIFLSAEESSARAAKVTPISAIRLNEEIKTKRKHTGKRVSKMFKRILGASKSLAILNYRRAKMKYRASVTSIAVSIALFLGMSFVGLLYEQKERDLWAKTNCQLTVSCYDAENWDEYFQTIKRLAKESEGITRMELHSEFVLIPKEGDVPFLPGKPDKDNSDQCLIRILDEESFALHCKDAGIDYEEAKGKGIVNAAERMIVGRNYPFNSGKSKATGNSLAAFQKGDVVRGEHPIYREKIDGEWHTEVIETEIEIAGQNDEIYALCEPYPVGYVTIYVGETWLEEHPEIWPLKQNLGVGGCFLGEDVNSFEDLLRDSDLKELYVYNYNREWQEMKYVEVMIKGFLGCFLFVIAMIGVTNVINAIGTNVELRTQEFARLRSIGMTGGQLRGMVRTEMMILGAKGSFYGILVGTGISYALYRFIWESGDKAWEFAYRIPWMESILCLLIVGVVLGVITERHLGRLVRKNVVEILRNENL